MVFFGHLLVPTELSPAIEVFGRTKSEVTWEGDSKSEVRREQGRIETIFS